MADYRGIFYYMRWINCLLIVCSGFAHWSGYLTMTQLWMIWAPIIIEHITLFILRWKEDREDYRQLEERAKYYEMKYPDLTTKDGSES